MKNAINGVGREASRRRLMKLADFLDTIPEKRFDYVHWVGNNWQGKPDLSCGTTACALGWATTIPAFCRLGLRLDLDLSSVVNVNTGTRNYWKFLDSLCLAGLLQTGYVCASKERNATFVRKPGVPKKSPSASAPGAEVLGEMEST